LSQLVITQEKERQSWEAECDSLRAKLEASESACRRSETESDKVRSKSTPNFLFYFWSNNNAFIHLFGCSAVQLESELSIQNQLLETKDSDLISAKEEVNFILHLTELSNLFKYLHLQWELAQCIVDSLPQCHFIFISSNCIVW
jgi:hypothetical protein